MKKKGKKYDGFRVVKNLPDGILVEEYKSLNEAKKAEGLSFNRLVEAIKNQLEINGHLYTCEALPVNCPQKKRYAVQRGRPVIKYDQSGNKVQEYVSVNEAAAAEGVKPQRIRNLMFYKLAKNGFTFKLGHKYPKKPPPPMEESKKPVGRRPWEGKNGMFNIVGWAGLPIPV